MRHNLRIFIDKGERYPHYRFSDVGHLGYLEADIPPETVKRWKAISVLFHQMQEELAILHTQSPDRKDAPRTKDP